MTKTFLIGLDGATFDVLQPLFEQGSMPFLEEFVRSGVRANLLSVIPCISPAAWTSLVTGRTPGNHGIFDFVRITREAAYMQYGMAVSTDIQCETLWSIVSRQGRQVATLNFPVAFPPIPIAGYSIPGYVPWRHLRRAVHPSGLYDRLATLPGFSPKELLLDLEQERKAIQVLEKEQYEEWITLHIRREEKWLEIVQFLMRNGNCDLLSVVFDGVDKIQHVCWRFIDPRLRRDDFSSWERKIVQLCRRYFQRLDEILAEVVTLAGSDSRFFFVSDHGFGATVELFYVNVWLEQEGYLAWAPDTPYDNEGKISMLESTRSAAVLFDWTKTKACALTSGSNGIYINVASEPGQPGVSPQDYISFREVLRREILAFRDPKTGQAIVTRAFTREELFPGNAMELAPDLTLQLRDGGFVSILNSEKPLREREEIMGTHRPEGVFLAAGVGIRKGGCLGQLSILDVAPAVLYSLGLPIPGDLEGQLPVEIFDDAFLRAPPPQWGPATISPRRINADSEDVKVQLDAAAEIEIMNRLKACGYL
jgi:predicted AlkP superfamily phosphohydrolase/phosphomutase